MLARIAKNQDGRAKHSDVESGRFQTHVLFNNNKLQDKKKGKANGVKPNYRPTNSFCSTNPQLRPSICSLILCLMVGISGIVMLVLAVDNLFIAGVVMISGGFFAACASAACFCVKRHTISKTTIKTDVMENDSLRHENTMAGVADPVMQRAIIHLKYRSCEEAWKHGQQRVSNYKVRLVTPARRCQYEVMNPAYGVTIQGSQAH